jgi:hypothetical protein
MPVPSGGREAWIASGGNATNKVLKSFKLTRDTWLEKDKHIRELGVAVDCRWLSAT